jgi:hypothetical protein
MLRFMDCILRIGGPELEILMRKASKHNGVAGQRARSRFLPDHKLHMDLSGAKPLDPARAAALDNLLSWGYSDGQTVAEKDGYTGLPPQLLTEVKRKLNELY